MINFLKQYFTFNNRQRNGVIVLIAVIVLLIISIQLAPYIVKQPAIEFVEIPKLTKPFSNTLAADSSTYVVQSSIYPELSENKMEENKITLFEFNPNSVTADELKRLGFSKKLVHTFINYRNKGGRFYKKTDLKKIYGVNENFYCSIEPYITFDLKNNYASAEIEMLNVKRQNTIANEQPIEINSADSITLLQLKGVGPAFAHRIISYRTNLGGFYNLQQLKEIYGIDSALFSLISNQLVLNANEIRLINLNTANVNELKKHPYIKYAIANLIINYRNQHGAYTNIEEIKKLHLVTHEVYFKLSPYLSVRE